MNLTEERKLARIIGNQIYKSAGYKVELKRIESINISKIAMIVDIGHPTVRPTIYLPDHIRDMDLADITEKIIADIAQDSILNIQNSMQEDASQFKPDDIYKALTNKDIFLSQIVFSLVNRKWNRKNYSQRQQQFL